MRQRWQIGESAEAVLTARDFEMLRLLFDFGYLSSEMLRQFVAPKTNPRVFSRRLKQLQDNPNLYIRRPAQQRDNYQANYSYLVYEITPKGIQALFAAGHISEEEREWRKRFMQQKYREFWHDLAMANVVASIKLAIKDSPTHRFVTPFSILKNAPETTQTSDYPFSVRTPERYIVPDYLFGIAHKAGEDEEYRFYWYEHDQGTEPVERKGKGSSFKRKLDDCGVMLTAKLYERHFDLDGLSVITVTIRERHLASIMARAEAMKHRRHLLFKALDASSATDRVPKPVPEIFREPWLRAGHEPKRIDQL
jgi:hypothetical protein